MMNKENKKKIYIQKHSSPCDIELVDGDYYLINNEEVKIKGIIKRIFPHGTTKKYVL